MCSPFAGRMMTKHGKVWVYIWGISLVSASSMLFSVATWLPAGLPFATWCFAMRLLQGIGSALEETAMYAIIADLDSEHVTFYLGICEISTGLGYMIGPPLGGFLFSAGGFAMPFVVLGLAVAPAAILLYRFMPPEAYRLSKGEDKSDVSMRSLMKNPQARPTPHARVRARCSWLEGVQYTPADPRVCALAMPHGMGPNRSARPPALALCFDGVSVRARVPRR